MDVKSVKFDEYNPQTDSWDNYLDRLKFCFEANGVILDSAKRANFFTVCGSRVYETLLALITPKKAVDVTFSEIEIILTNHYSPKPNEISVSYKFYNCNQKREQSSFDMAKSLLAFDLTLVHYDVNKPVVLTCDSSEYGVGAVLSHEIEDGQERPIAMASRTLHAHERRYSQLDKEATSIMFGIKKFHNYLMGRHFRIITDHKPLLGIFNPKKPMSNMLSPRLTRIAIALMSHDYEIAYKPGSQIGNADSLSRWPQPVKEQPEQQLSEVLLMAETPDDFPFNAKDIAIETKRDKTLSQVIYYIQRGWPARITDTDLRPFWLHRTELSLQEDCILLGCRVLVPKSMRHKTLQILHKTHTGIVQTKALARSNVWWPNLNEDIETLVRGCQKCLENRHMPQKSSHEWITPTKPWSRIHIDFAGPYHKKYFLIIVDAYSRWPELFMVNNTTSSTVIRLLRTTFATHGLCEVVVSDNGPSFVSKEMNEFLKANNIRHVTTAPYHPSTNGLAERMVQTIKDKLCKMEDLAWDTKIPNLLLGLRVTPCTTTNKSPSELLMKRCLRTLLDTIHPESAKNEKTETQISNNSQRKNRETNVGQEIMYRNYSSTGPRWLPGKVMNKKGPSNYEIRTNNGTIINRHIDQLIKKGPNIHCEDSERQEGERMIRAAESVEGVYPESSDSINNEENQESSQDSDIIIEIPDSNKWAEMLGIPSTAETTLSTSRKIKHKTSLHSKTPYERSNANRENLYIS